MQELAFAGNDNAKSWLAERNIEERVPAIEVARREAEAKAAEEAACLAEQEAQLSTEQVEYVQEAQQELKAAGVPEDVAHKEALRLALPHSPQDDYVFLGWLDDVRSIKRVMNGDLRLGRLVNGVWYSDEEVAREQHA